MILRFLILLVCAVVVLFGLGCLNYTAFENHAHHVSFAEEYKLPEPSTQIHQLGMAATAVGSFLMGYFIRKH